LKTARVNHLLHAESAEVENEVTAYGQKTSSFWRFLRIKGRLKIVKERVNFLEAANKFPSAIIIYMAKREAFLIELPSLIQ